jgi:hypothetical protein
MGRAVCPLSAPSANHRIDPTAQIDRNDSTTPVQQAPRSLLKLADPDWLVVRAVVR